MKYVWKALGIYVAFLLQSLIFENLRIFSCSPDVLAAVVIIVAVSEDFVPASILGGFAGLLYDVMYGEVFGISILLYTYLALLVGIAADRRNSNSPLIMSWVSFVSIASLEIVQIQSVSAAILDVFGIQPCDSRVLLDIAILREKFGFLGE